MRRSFGLLLTLSALACAPATSPEAPAPDPLNVLLVSVDTLRPDHLSLYGYPRSTSPHLEAWAERRGQVFETAIASSPWTLPSHVSMLTGLDATTHGVNADRIVPAEIELLAERFVRRGYVTAAFTGGGFVHPEFGLDRGFERFEAWEEARKDPREITTNVDHTLEFLEGRQPGDPPFFVFFHTYETHEPYRARQPFFSDLSDLPADFEVRLRQEALVPGEGRTFRKRLAVLDPVSGVAAPLPPDLVDLPVDLYDSGVASMDAQLERIWSHLERTGLADETIVVFTSDHGELLGEHDVAGHAYPWEENLRIPFVLAVPGRSPARHEHPVARLIDLVPTLLDLIGAEIPGGLDGRSLRPWLEGRAPAGDRPVESWSYSSKPNSWLALRRGGSKLVLSTDPFRGASGRHRAFDLRRDPAEQSPLSVDPTVFGSHRLQLERIPGFRLQLVNREPTPLALRLEGPAAAVRGVKSIHRPGPPLAWNGDTVEGIVPPGLDLDLLLEAAPGSDLLLTLSVPGAPDAPHRSRWMLDADRPGELRLVDGRWTPEPATGPTAPSTLKIFSQGALGAVPAVPELSDERRRQLEALGYVD